MPTYSYKARDAAGKPVKGAMDGATKEEIIARLGKMGYMPTQVTESPAALKVESVFERFKRISTEDMVMFNVQLSNMINAGINLLTGLNTLNKQIENTRLKRALGDISRNVEAGDSFSVALSKHPRIFPSIFVNMVKAGETSGKLDTVLARYAEFFEYQADLRQKIKGALFYPMILLFAGIVVTLFIVTFVIPQFAEIFMKTGIRLPLPTLILYKIGTWIKDFWYFGILFIAIIWFAIGYYGRTARGKFILDRLKLRSPLIGPLSRKAAISRFTRTLSTLIASGVPILQSLDIANEVGGNEVLFRAITGVRKSVEKGERIAEPLKISGEFPPDTIQMISVGEETGNLDGMLDKISSFYDMSLGYIIKRLTSVIEPLFLVIMACMVGFIMASMLLPIFDMIKILRH